MHMPLLSKMHESGSSLDELKRGGILVVRKIFLLVQCGSFTYSINSFRFIFIITYSNFIRIVVFIIYIYIYVVVI